MQLMIFGVCGSNVMILVGLEIKLVDFGGRQKKSLKNSKMGGGRYL
jgi:hypothetical protein